MPRHSEGPEIWFSDWRFLLTHCLYERAAKVLARLRGCYKYQIRLTRSIIYNLTTMGASPGMREGSSFFMATEWLCCFDSLSYASENSLNSDFKLLYCFRVSACKKANGSIKKGDGSRNATSSSSRWQGPTTPLIYILFVWGFTPQSTANS